MTGSVLILGGTSDIGGEILTRTCAGRRVYLAARDPASLDDAAEHARSAGATEVHRLRFEATDFSSHRALIEQVRAGGEISLAVVAFGILGDQERAEREEDHAAEIATIDYTAQISLLTVLADILRRQDAAANIVAFSSIAGWRARRANYVYGSTKAGLDAFCQGLRDALHGSNVSLVTARPGFVIGSMTRGMTPAPLSVTPADVAEAVTAQLAKNRSATLWIPGTLRLLAAAMRLVPRPVWRVMPR